MRLAVICVKSKGESISPKRLPKFRSVPRKLSFSQCEHLPRSPFIYLSLRCDGCCDVTEARRVRHAQGGDRDAVTYSRCFRDDHAGRHWPIDRRLEAYDSLSVGISA